MCSNRKTSSEVQAGQLLLDNRWRCWQQHPLLLRVTVKAMFLKYLQRSHLLCSFFWWLLIHSAYNTKWDNLYRRGIISLKRQVQAEALYLAVLEQKRSFLQSSFSSYHKSYTLNSAIFLSRAALLHQTLLIQHFLIPCAQYHLSLLTSFNSSLKLSSLLPSSSSQHPNSLFPFKA